MRALAIVALLTFAVGASAAVALSPPPDPADPGIADGSKQRKLDAAKRSWKAARLSDYRFQITQQCFCMPIDARQVVVRGGRPTQYPNSLKDVATVPRLFRRIQRAIDTKSTKLTATYGKRGVPKRIYIDGRAYIADDEVGYTITGFTHEPSRPR